MYKNIYRNAVKHGKNLICNSDFSLRKEDHVNW